MSSINRDVSFDEINECRHMLCLLFREYRIVTRAFDRKSTFFRRFLKIKEQAGLILFKYSEADDRRISHRGHSSSWWLSETYMPLQLELDMHEDPHSLPTYKRKLCHLLKTIYENLDRSLNELDRREIQVFGRTGRIARDAVRHEVYCFLDKEGVKPRAARGWEIHDRLVVIHGGQV